MNPMVSRDPPVLTASHVCSGRHADLLPPWHDAETAVAMELLFSEHATV
jgi:hypothetical protein